MNRHVKKHIEWLEGRELLLSEGIKRKPKARDLAEAKAELRAVRAVIKKLKS
jgi:hypothetical protein